jgi:hypothetical protein
MRALNITESAWRVIRQALERTTIAEPVVYLIEASQGQPPPELGKAIAEGADESVLREILAKGVDLPKGRRRLVPAIYPRSQLSKWFMHLIDGVQFYFPPTISSRISKGTLDAGEGGLVLKDADGKVVMPAPNGG